MPVNIKKRASDAYFDEESLNSMLSSEQAYEWFEVFCKEEAIKRAFSGENLYVVYKAVEERFRSHFQYEFSLHEPRCHLWNIREMPTYNKTPTNNWMNQQLNPEIPLLLFMTIGHGTGKNLRYVHGSSTILLGKDNSKLEPQLEKMKKDHEELLKSLIPGLRLSSVLTRFDLLVENRYKTERLKPTVCRWLSGIGKTPNVTCWNVRRKATIGINIASRLTLATNLVYQYEDIIDGEKKKYFLAYGRTVVTRNNFPAQLLRDIMKEKLDELTVDEFEDTLLVDPEEENKEIPQDDGGNLENVGSEANKGLETEAAGAKELLRSEEEEVIGAVGGQVVEHETNVEQKTETRPVTTLVGKNRKTVPLIPRGTLKSDGMKALNLKNKEERDEKQKAERAGNQRKA